MDTGNENLYLAVSPALCTSLEIIPISQAAFLDVKENNNFENFGHLFPLITHDYFVGGRKNSGVSLGCSRLHI